MIPPAYCKDERFNRTLKQELLKTTPFVYMQESQYRFDVWRDRFYLIRPHEALDLDDPFRHDLPSQRAFLGILPPLEYPLNASVRQSHSTGNITYHDKEYRVGKGLVGESVELCPTEKDGCFDV